MYYLQPFSLRGLRPTYQYLEGGSGRLFMPEARVAIDYATTGPYASHMLQYVCSRFLSPQKTALDIGAQVGIYSLAMAPKSKHVHAFECCPQTFNYLCANLALNNLSHRVTPHRIGASDQDGNTEMVIRDPGDGGSNGIEIFQRDRDLQTPVVTVERRTLDSFGFESVGFLKIDVEGHELSVLKGAQKTLELSDYPAVLFESWSLDREKEGLPAKTLRESIFRYLQSLEYRIEDAPHGYGENFIATRSF